MSPISWSVTPGINCMNTLVLTRNLLFTLGYGSLNVIFIYFSVYSVVGKLLGFVSAPFLHVLVEKLF